MNAPLYTTEILRLAASLPEPQQLERIDGASTQRSPTCGSTVATAVRIEEGRIQAISQTVSACAFGQASATLVAQQAPGRNRADVQATLDELSAWLSDEGAGPPGWPGFEALAPARSRTGRHGAIMLPLRALLAAMDPAG
jgi:NifU-like protein involved in Fe-S cluster formation